MIPLQKEHTKEVNDETRNDDSGEKDIGHYQSGNGENVKTIDGTLDRSETVQVGLIKVELSKLDETGKCETGKN